MVETLEPLHYRARKWLLQQVTPSINSPTQHQRLLDTDWDILLILDACRFDALQSIGTWPVQKEIAPAGNTADWLLAAVESQILADAIVITASPQYNDKVPEIPVRELIDISSSEQDPRLETVPPKAVLDQVDEAVNDEGPVAGHLLQPHIPYVHRVGETWIDGLGDSWKNREYDSAQVAMTRGSIDRKTAKEAYRSSVRSIQETVEPYIEQWINAGQHVVVTADHGEAFGELRNFGMVGHPRECHIPSLVQVPFIEFHPPSENDEGSRDALKALGYIE